MKNFKWVLGNILPPPIKPHDHQVPIIKKVVSAILNKENGLVIQPTATGKSTEAALVSRICILFHNMKGLYLYDENEGILQARKMFENIFNGNNISCANFFGYGKDDFVEDADIVFASFQSLNNYHEKWYKMFSEDHFDFIIVNEAHHGQAVTYKEVIDHFSCSKIGMTATPERMDGKDILDIFDNVIHEISLEEAIVKGWVNDVEYHIVSHELSTQMLKQICSEVLEEGKRISIKQLNESIFIDALDEVVIKEIYNYAFPEDYFPRQTLIYCENILHAERVFALIKEDNKSVGIIHSKRGNTHNRNTMSDFRENKIQFLISIDKLNEDIDVPDVELGVFLRATDSWTVFWQQLGRPLRKIDGKGKTIILDFVANCERLILISELMRSIKEILKKQHPKGLPLQKDPFSVSGEGFDFNLSDNLVDVLNLINVLKIGKFDTWQEASSVAVKFGIKTSREYKDRRIENLQLPSCPNTFYKDFPGWPVFLKVVKNYYPTWQDASLAVMKIGIKTYGEYQKRYGEDPLLISNPSEHYKDFPGWQMFFYGVKKYKTWKQASRALKKLGINSYDSYRKLYKRDIRLVSNPSEHYKDFPGWPVFLNKAV